MITNTIKVYSAVRTPNSYKSVFEHCGRCSSHLPCSSRGKVAASLVRGCIARESYCQGSVEVAVKRRTMGSESKAPKLENGSLVNGAPKELDADGLTVEGVKFSPTLAAPGLGKDLTLIGGGVRKVRKPNGIELKVTVLGVYADLEIVSHLSKYRGLSAEQLLRDDEFIYAFLEAPVDIAARVAYLLPLTGADYASKSGDNTEEDLKAMNKWGEAEELALKDYREYFKTKNCPPGSSVYFTITRSGLKISHSLDASVPKEPEFLVKSTAFGVALLGTMFSGKGVSPQLRASCGQKMASLLQH